MPASTSTTKWRAVSPSEVNRGAVTKKLGGVNNLDGLFVVSACTTTGPDKNLLAVNAQVAIHRSREWWGQPEAIRILLTLGTVAAAIEDDVRTLSLGLVDPW